MTFQAVMGVIAGIVGLLAYVPYFISTVAGTTRPNRTSWWIWTVLGVVLCASYYSAGARTSLWVPVSYAIGPLVIALFAVKYGEGGWSLFETACLAGSGASLVLWWLIGSPLVALAMNILIDLFGSLPTVRKAYLDPRSESLSGWTLFLLADLLNLTAISSWTVATTIYPLYLVALGVVVTALLLRPRAPKRATSLP